MIVDTPDHIDQPKIAAKAMTLFAPTLPPSLRYPQGAGGGHEKQRVSRGFRDTRDTKTEVVALEIRTAVVLDRGAQVGLVGGFSATADRAILEWRAV